jgi:hypothetical protein
MRAAFHSTEHAGDRKICERIGLEIAPDLLNGLFTGNELGVP